mmetsp:Transcript_34686/g.58899  ORF Transcript_34686/g.58899 Transcript_34686/m.58899 type:complete len:252 (+) Transcript_34686:192-947(+)|eukprot:CAMPEP_0183743216 /NCGR_PEP_ID=MMETSP0737-20130205/65104_1 /TAXON_ID=385413 /ORGANISM="Thalassiosira miniscula, Strain CCMP1093" /LENGTH=251 /DNA_ID=CAMNT_0025978825 /DNA_START=119 /DNA_END=874 /DNA_ORIENTATION=-
MTVSLNKNGELNGAVRQPYGLDSGSTFDPVENLSDETKNKRPPSEAITNESQREMPLWVKEQFSQWGESICVPEWDDDETIYDNVVQLGDCKKNGDGDCYRSKNGWKGTDLCHSKKSPVRISHYAVRYKEGGIGTTLTGVCHFTNNAESHAGFCHGGSMTSVMDDVIGWTAFLVTGKCVPWSGFTAQVNVSLRRPVAVGSYLKIVGKITKWEGRKVSIYAQLLVGEDNGERPDIVHCSADGLVILKKENFA